MRRSAIFLLVVFSGCPATKPEPLYVDINTSTLSPVGWTSFAYAFAQMGEPTATARVFRDGALVHEEQCAEFWHFEDSPDSAVAFFYAAEPGDFSLEVEVFQRGKSVGVGRETVHVYPTFRVTQHLGRACQRLDPLDDAATEFDCDGTVIDASGSPIAGRAQAPEVKVVHTAQGAVRWLRTGATVALETASGVTNAVDFPPDVRWAAAADFATAGDVLVMFDQGALSRVTFDGRQFMSPGPAGWDLPFTYEPTAASSQRGVRVVAYRPVPLHIENNRLDQSTYSFCLLELNALGWRLTACPEATGALLRQERTDDRRVVFQARDEIWWLDMTTPETHQVKRTLTRDEVPLRDGSFDAAGDGLRAVFSRGDTLDVRIPVQPEWSNDDFDGGAGWRIAQLPFAASSDFTWASDGDGGTWWGALP